MNISKQIYIARLKSHPVECLAEVYKEKADVLSHTGDYNKATEVYTKAKTYYSSLNKKGKCADIDYEMGNVLENKGSFREAEDHFNTALTIFTKCNEVNNIAKCYREIGKLYQYREDSNSALTFYSKAKELYQQINDQEGNMRMMEYFADIYRSKGEYFKALNEVDQLREILKESEDTGTLCRINKLTGKIFMDQGNHEKAKTFFNIAYQYTKNTGENSMAMYILCDLGATCFYEEDFITACLHFEECLALAEKLDSTYMKAINLLNIADALLKMGDIQRSKGYISRAATINHNIGGLNSEIERVQKEIAEKESDKKETH